MNYKRKMKYLKITLFILVPFLVLWGITMAFMMNVKSSWQQTVRPQPETGDQILIEQPNNPKQPTETVDPSEQEQLEDSITVAIIGVDKKGYLTDVMISAVYNPNNNVLDLITIPRDTKVTFNEKIYKQLTKRGWLERTHKLNEVNGNMSRLGVAEPLGYTLNMMSSITGLQYDYYVEINPEIFSNLIDAIGGVKIYVPRDMEYEDPVQDLYIHLKEGYQQLSGKEAQGFVRWRKGYVDGNLTGYANGDLGRIETQQYFMRILLDNLKPSTIIVNYDSILETVFSNVKTDMSIEQASQYALKYAFNLPSLTLRTHTIPGKPGKIKAGGKDYYIIDDYNTSAFVSNKLSLPIANIDGNSIGAKIRILNGSRTTGLASYHEKKLVEDGYTVTGIGNFDGTRNKITKIYVNDPNIGADLVSYFNYAEVVIDGSNLGDDDILIVLGLNEFIK